MILSYLKERPKPTTWRNERFIAAELKLDGIRLTIWKDSQGKISAYGRKSYIDLWPQLSRNREILAAMEFVPYDTILDGELYADVVDSVTGGKSSDVISTLKFDVENIKFAAFAAPRLSSRDLRLARYYDMRSHVEQIWPWTIPVIFDSGASRETMLDWISANRAEGLVLKASGYSVWWKLKPEQTVDAIITGFREGQGRHSGKVGSIVVSVLDGENLVEIANVSGMDDETRYALSDKDLNRVIEVRHDGIDKTRLRFPRFIRFRDDKPASECTIDQLKFQW